MGSEQMILITGGVRVDPAHRAAAMALAIEHSRRSRGEPGCLAHNCHIDAEDADRIVFIERWADLAAVQTHFAVPESRRFVAELRAMAIGEPEIALFAADPLPAPGL
jgi:quinol monooxygenase YgiN